MAITAGAMVRVVEGSTALGVSKGSRGTVRSVTVADRGMAKVVLDLPAARKTLVLWARHANRLQDATTRLNNGDPFKAIRVEGLAAPAAKPARCFYCGNTGAQGVLRAAGAQDRRDAADMPASAAVCVEEGRCVAACEAAQDPR